MADPGFLGGGQYNGERERIKGVWERSPQWGSMGEASGRGPGGKTPEVEDFENGRSNLAWIGERFMKFWLKLRDRAGVKYNHFVC